MNYRKSEDLEVPHGNNTIWRYMSKCKFSRLLENSALFFPNANKLSDKYEVSIPESTEKQKQAILIKQGLSGDHLEKEMSLFYSHTNPRKDLVLINCWSLNPHESYALWKIYLGGSKDGVAIKTKISRLQRSIKNGGDAYPEDFFIGKVKYRRHLKGHELSRHSIISTKKPFYDFEKEIRVFILNNPIEQGSRAVPYDISIGRTVKVDLKEMIHEVYISPFSDENYRKEVETAIKEKGLPNTIIKSSEIKDQ